MYNYHVGLIWQLDKIFAAASFLLAAFIMAYAAVKSFLARRRMRQLALLKIRLERVALSKDISAGERCRRLIGNDPLEASLESSKLDLSSQLNAQLKTCFAAQEQVNLVQNIALNSKNKWRRIQAIIMLGSLGEAGIAALKKGLADRDEDVVYFSMLALGGIKSMAAAKILLDFLGRHVFSGQKIISLLEGFPQDIHPEVIKNLRSPDSSVRFWSLKLLAKFKPAPYLRQIIPLTIDSSADVRSAACQYLAGSQDLWAKEALKNRLGDEVWFVRMQAVRALAKIIKGKELEIISPLLEDADLLVRESAKEALAQNIKNES